jgi:hypothetical protein
MITKADVDEALSLAVKVSPSAVEQKKFIDMLHAMQKDKCASERQLCELLSGIINGVQYGNWPK